VKNKEFFLDKAEVCKMQFMRGFKTVTKQVKKKKKVIMDQFRDGRL